MIVPTKNEHFGVFWGYHHLRKHPYTVYIYIYGMKSYPVIWVFPKIGYPKMDAENNGKPYCLMDDLWVLGTPIFGNIHMRLYPVI